MALESGCLLEYCARGLALAARDSSSSWAAIERKYLHLLARPAETVNDHLACQFALRALRVRALVTPEGRLAPAPAHDWLTLQPEAQCQLLLGALHRAPEAVLPWPTGGPDLAAQTWQAIIACLGNDGGFWPHGSELVSQAVERMAPTTDGLNTRTKWAARQRVRTVITFVVEWLLPALGVLQTSASGATELTPSGRLWLKLDVPAPESVEPLFTAALETKPVLCAMMMGAGCHVEITRPAPAALVFDLEMIGQRLEEPALIYALDVRSLDRAAGHGYDLATVRNLLVAWAHWLPADVEAWLDELAQRRTTVGLQPGYRLFFDSAQALTAACARRSVGGHLRRGISGCEGWVTTAELPTVLRSLAAQGLQVHASATGDEAPLGAPAEFVALPRLPLLVALQTYRLLQRALPSLAPLDLAPLCQRLRHGLAPAERLAADRLVRSHARLLTQRLGKPGPGESVEIASDATPGCRAALAPTWGAPHALVYVDGAGRLTSRVATPVRLEQRGTVSLLIATHPHDAEEHTFRADRILALLPLDQPEQG